MFKCEVLSLIYLMNIVYFLTRIEPDVIKKIFKNKNCAETQNFKGYELSNHCIYWSIRRNTELQ